MMQCFLKKICDSFSLTKYTKVMMLWWLLHFYFYHYDYFLMYFPIYIYVISCISPSMSIFITPFQTEIMYVHFMNMCWMFSSAIQHNIHFLGPIHPLLCRLSCISTVFFCTSHRNVCILLGILIFHIFSAMLWDIDSLRLFFFLLISTPSISLNFINVIRETISNVYSKKNQYTLN